jgi:hypothetical protein
MHPGASVPEAPKFYTGGTMKIIYTIIAFFVIQSSLFCQNSEFVLDSISNYYYSEEISDWQFQRSIKYMRDDDYMDTCRIHRSYSLIGDSIENKTKYINRYDDENKLIVYMIQDYKPYLQPDVSPWVAMEMIGYEYEGNTVTEIKSEMKFTPPPPYWEKSEKTRNTLDNNGRCIEEISYEWDSDTERFIPAKKVTFAYCEHGRTHREKYRWNSEKETWDFYRGNYNDYNELGLETSYLSIKQSGNKIDTLIHGIIEYEYNQYNLPIAEYYYTMVNDKRINTGKRFITYEGQKIKTDTLYSYNHYDSEWYNQKILQYEYDNNDRVITKKLYKGKDNGWAKDTLYNYIFDSNDLHTETIKSAGKEGEWTNSIKISYHYIPITSVAERGDSPASVRIFPNPAGEYLEYEIAGGMRFDRMVIKDLNGRTLIEQPVGAVAGRIDIDQLNDGIYFIQFISAAETINLKFVKTR